MRSKKRLSCSTIFIFILLLAAMKSYAQSSAHHVKNGETLFSIAHDYHITVQQLKQWNNLSSNTISIGQVLTIKKQGASDPLPTGTITHTVQPNETLFGLAQEYGVSIGNIKRWNDLQGSTLKVGSVLTFYEGKENSANTVVATQKSAPTPPPVSGNSSYTVKSGDTLFRIAHVHNMSVDQLKQLNGLASNNIQVGQQLKVQASAGASSIAAMGIESSAQGKFLKYTIKEPQSRAALLDKFKMTETTFEALNPEVTAASFQKGDRVVLLAPPTKNFSNPYRAKTALTSLGNATVSRYQNTKVTTTTSGELYNPQALTAAHASMAMGSVIFIRNKANQRGVFVRINDRITGPGLKISKAAWNTLGFTGNNTRVTMFRNNE